MHKISPCLWFETQAEEAAGFYVSVFKNSAITYIMRAGEAGPGPIGSVIFAMMSLDGMPIMALNGNTDDKFTMAMSLSIDCEDQDEVDYYWEKLTDGGSEIACGWLKDKFGVAWQVVPRELDTLLGDPDPARAARAMTAMMQMIKLDVNTIRLAMDET